MTEKDLKVLYGEIVSRCWEDEAFKKRFITDAAGVLKEAGIPVEVGVTYQVVEAAENDLYVILPDKQVAETVQELTKLLLTVSEKSEVIVPEGSRIIVLQNTAKVHYLLLTKAPEVVSDVELDMVAGGGKNYTAAYHAMAVVDVVAVAAVHSIAAGAAAVAGAYAVVLALGVFI